MQTIKATFVRDHIAEIGELARKGPVAVEYRGQTEFVILSASDYERLTRARKPRQPGFAKHLFQGMDVNEMLATPIPGFDVAKETSA